MKQVKSVVGGAIARRKSAVVTAIAVMGWLNANATDYSTWYQYTGADNQLSFTAACWVDPADPDATKTSAQAGRQYFVPEGKTASAANASATFADASLAVAGTLRYTTANATYTVNDLILRPGGTLNEATSVTVAGKLTVEGTVASPSTWITFLFSTRKFYYKPRLVGGPTAFLYVGTTSVNPRSNLFKDTHSVTMDMSAYEGEIAFRGLRFAFAPSKDDIPGKITVCANTILDVSRKSGSYTVGSLAFENGAELRLGSTWNDCGYFSVTNSISFGSSFAFSSTSLSTNGYRIAKLSGVAAATAPDVTSVAVTFADPWGEVPKNAHLEVVDCGDGTKDVRVVWDPIEVLIKNTSYNENTDVLAVADAWASGVVPSADFEGDIVMTGITTVFRAYGTIRRNGWHFSLRDSTLSCEAYNLYLDGVDIAGSSTIRAAYINDANPHRLYAPIRVFGGTCNFSGWGSRRLHIYGTISGTGTITGFHKVHGDQTQPFGLGLFGDDSGFTGDYSLSLSDTDVLDPDETPENFIIEIGGQFKFGGDYSGANAWKSVRFTRFPYVHVSSDLSLTNATRGVLVQEGVVFEVANGKTLTIGEGMTYGGVLVKRGAGALVLGNETTKFLASTEQTDTPAAGTNGLRIVEGSLKVAAVDAVNGLAVSFADGVRLVVDVGATGDLKTYGARNVKWETPFSSDAAIPVVFDGEFASDNATLGICTISSTAAAPTFALPERHAKRKVTAIGWRTNADGSRTYEVELKKPGFELIIL